MLKFVQFLCAHVDRESDNADSGSDLARRCHGNRMTENDSARHDGDFGADFKQKLWQAFARSVRDNVMAEVAVQVLRLGGMMILARALYPEDFGLLKILFVVGMFANLVTEAGLPEALVQRKELTPEHEATAWWLSLMLASASACALYFTAPLIARAMEMTALTTGIRLLCIPVLLEGTSVISNARLRRRLDFRALAAADVFAETAFLSTALALLWFGYPRFSLAGGLGARYTIHALTIWCADAHIPLQMPRLDAARDLGRFSLSAVGAGFTVVASANADYVLVGRLLGSTALGYYAVSWDLLRFVISRLHRVAVRVIFPAFARLQDDDQELARAYKKLISYLAIIVLPVTVFAAIAAPEILRAIYGSKWMPATEPLRLLAGGLAVCGLREGIGPMFYAKGRPALDIYLNSVRLVLIVATVSFLSRFGLVGVSAGMSIVEATIAVAGIYSACWLIKLKMTSLFSSIIPGLRLALCCAAAAMAGKAIVLLCGIQGPVALLVLALPTAVTFLLLEKSEVNRIVIQFFARRGIPVVQA